MPSLVAEKSDAQRLTEADPRWTRGFVDDEIAALGFDWPLWRRPSQTIPEGDWDVWLVLAGRGYGKTRTGAETVRAKVEAGEWGRVALVAPTAADARDVMIEGESGIMAVCPPWNRPKYEPSKRRVTWPNGAQAISYSADEPERLRGPQHDGAWGDEPASWRYGQDAWDMLQLGLRLGKRPQTVVTGTPKRVKWLHEVSQRATTVLTRRSTYDNIRNLPKSFRDLILDIYEGTRLGRQELHAEFLMDVEGALWALDLIDLDRMAPTFDMEGYLVLPPVTRLVVAVDPPASETGAEAGIIVAARGDNGHGYILDDLSVRGSPATWGRQAVEAAAQWEADAIVYERNQGGDMVKHTLQSVMSAEELEAFKLRDVWASKGKRPRAEPVSTLYERHKVHHVGTFAALEEQMTSWTDSEPVSPDRMDALVWALSDLLLPKRTKVRLVA